MSIHQRLWRRTGAYAAYPTLRNAYGCVSPLLLGAKKEQQLSEYCYLGATDAPDIALREHCTKHAHLEGPMIHCHDLFTVLDPQSGPNSDDETVAKRGRDLDGVASLVYNKRHTSPLVYAARRGCVDDHSVYTVSNQHTGQCPQRLHATCQRGTLQKRM